MNKELVKDIIKFANMLDEKGLHKEADYLDNLISKAPSTMKDRSPIIKILPVEYSGGCTVNHFLPNHENYILDKRVLKGDAGILQIVNELINNKDYSALSKEELQRLKSLIESESSGYEKLELLKPILYIFAKSYGKADFFTKDDTGKIDSKMYQLIKQLVPIYIGETEEKFIEISSSCKNEAVNQIKEEFKQYIKDII